MHGNALFKLFNGWLQALQGDVGTDAALLPDDGDDHDDTDFMLDLDDLLAFGEDEQPSPATSPLQTRFRRSDQSTVSRICQKDRNSREYLITILAALT